MVTVVAILGVETPLRLQRSLDNFGLAHGHHAHDPGYLDIIIIIIIITWTCSVTMMRSACPYLSALF